LPLAGSRFLFVRDAINHYTTVLNYTPIPITIPLQSENEKAFSLTILAAASLYVRLWREHTIEHIGEAV